MVAIYIQTFHLFALLLKDTDQLSDRFAIFEQFFTAFVGYFERAQFFALFLYG